MCTPDTPRRLILDGLALAADHLDRLTTGPLQAGPAEPGVITLRYADKVVAETALLAWLAARAARIDPDLDTATSAVVTRLLPLARSSRLAEAIVRRPAEV